MFSQALHELPVQLIAGPHVGEVAGAEQGHRLPVRAVELRPDDPLLGGAVGRHRPVEVALLPRRLPRRPGVRAEPEHPEVPRVVVGLGHDRPAPSAREPRPDPAPQAGPDLDVVGHRGVDDVVEKADPQDLSEPLARLVVGVGTALRIRVADAPVRELLETDEVQGVETAAAAVLGRDEHVHLGVVAVANVVHEGDLASQKIEVAPVAVKEHPERGRAPGNVLRIAEARPDAEDPEDQPQPLPTQRHLPGSRNPPETARNPPPAAPFRPADPPEPPPFRGPAPLPPARARISIRRAGAPGARQICWRAIRRPCRLVVPRSPRSGR